MVAPLVALSVPTILIGLIGAPLPSGTPGSEIFAQWLNTAHMSSFEVHERNWIEFALESLPSVGIAITGAFVAWIIYGPSASRSRNLIDFLDPVKEGILGSVLNSIYNWSLRRGYIDEIYEKIFVWSTRAFSRLTFVFDQWVIDGVVNNTGLLSLFGGESTRYVEGGRTTAYVFLIGVVTLSLFCFFFILN
jgi:NADH:ubiquinone oxidoreductase subunit 5 (subunit L)/multisubunit Na+/H+ antiporter MnhA subunit